eukprot:CAMPEP_0174885814 /NCGR_PEP_ID=MMETSP0167-20121228/1075_1 /TAXON_ID=38298 /ORGANISM="Rhodella maculata, Strain CCMP736" /LENGTH=134 /DNA_ID=CAMNT_0016121521 /DNA_START=59 /DNA_END=463 /DNA_ORIENTATION=-
MQVMSAVTYFETRRISTSRMRSWFQNATEHDKRADAENILGLTFGGAARAATGRPRFPPCGTYPRQTALKFRPLFQPPKTCGLSSHRDFTPRMELYLFAGFERSALTDGPEEGPRGRIRGGAIEAEAREVAQHP